jgi:hypothetical protein
MAPEEQDFWRDNVDDGYQLIPVMVSGNGASPTAEEQASWAADPGIDSPLLLDEAAVENAYVTTGYPTFVLIDRTMTIVDNDQWPYDEGAILDLL